MPGSSSNINLGLNEESSGLLLISKCYSESVNYVN